MNITLPIMDRIAPIIKGIWVPNFSIKIEAGKVKIGCISKNINAEKFTTNLS